MNIYELHEKMTAGLFPAYSNSDVKFLTLAICGEAGELANLIKKRWRDNVDLSEEIRDEIADCRVYTELLAKCFDIEGAKLDGYFIDDNSWTTTGERTLSLTLCAVTGRLADAVVYSIPNEDYEPVTGYRANIIIIRVIIEKLARLFDIGGDKLNNRVEQKLVKVIAKHKDKLADKRDF